MRTMQHALEIDIEDARPDLRRHGGKIRLLDAEAAHAAGRVDERVDAAVAREQVLHRRVDLRAVGGVELQCLGVWRPSGRGGT